jgi:hypothetical protein
MVEIGRKDDSWQKPARTHSAHSLAKLKKAVGVNRRAVYLHGQSDRCRTSATTDALALKQPPMP